MTIRSILISLILIGSLIVLAPSAAAQDPVPVGVDPNADCNGTPGTRITVFGEEFTCIPQLVGALPTSGYAASFSMGPQGSVPVLVANADGEYRLTVSLLQRVDGTYGLLPDGTSVGLVVEDLLRQRTTLPGETSAGGQVTFTFTAEDLGDGSTVQLARLYAVVGGVEVTFTIPSNLLFTQEPALADGVQTFLNNLDAEQVVLLVTAGLPPGLMDRDEDGVIDAVDNCPPTDDAPDGTPNPGQEDADLDRIGDACDAEPQDGPLGDLDNDGFPNGVEEAADSDPEDPESTPGSDVTGGAGDIDEDGVPNAQDNCPATANPPVDDDGDPNTEPTQPDLDGDGFGDACDADRDGDGFLNDLETALESDPDDPDSTPAGAAGDLDEDGVGNLQDNCPIVANPPIDDDGDPNTEPTQPDLDGDGFGDACDLDRDGDAFPNDVETALETDPDDPDSTPLGQTGDVDQDGKGDLDDNCPTTANPPVDEDGDPNTEPTQPDLDGDGFGDACDGDRDGDAFPNAAEEQAGSDPDDPASTPTQSAVDPDGDGVLSTGAASLPVSDNCPTVANADQADLDDDGDGDVCDTDLDADGVADKEGGEAGYTSIPASAGGDNCPHVANSVQTDLDGDLVGDDCDVDIDGDGVDDKTDNGDHTFSAKPPTADPATSGDNCPSVANAAQADIDGDLIGDVCDPDIDGDSVSNLADNCPSVANADQADSDGDGIGDACDVDLDGDVVDDAIDNCVGVFNPKVDHDNDAATPAIQPNADGDALGDACEVDADDDGHDDKTFVDGRFVPLAQGDNCPVVANANQADFDSDGIGDACDADIDGDGIAQQATLGTCIVWTSTSTGPRFDRFPYNPAEWHDSDCDGVGDNADPRPNDAAHSVDTDGDGVPDGLDNCPNFVNPNQADSNNNKKGDACEDSDGDGVADAFDDNDGDGRINGIDNCPNVANANQADGDGDGIGDACDTNLKNGPKGDLDGDGYTNQQETQAGTNVNDATSFPGATTAPALVLDMAKSLRGTTTVSQGVDVHLQFSAPTGAQGIQILRSTSPWSVIATLPTTATTYTDDDTSLGARYIAIAYGAEGPVADPELELAYLDDLVAKGHYYQAKAPATQQGDGVRLSNGNGQASQVEIEVDILDRSGKVMGTQEKTVSVPAHGDATFLLDEVDTSKGAKYNLYVVGDDGERSLVASGTLKQGPEFDSSLLWVLSGGVLLLMILVVAVAGIVAYARQEPEEVMA